MFRGRLAMKYRTCALLLPLVLFPLARTAKGDVITMKNGDHLSGSIVKLDGSNLIFKSEYGPITIPWASLVSISTSAPVFIDLKDGRTLQGGVTGENETFTIKPSSANEVSAAKADITAIRNAEEQHSYDVALNPGWLDMWTGNVDLGYAQASGNSKTKNFTIAGAATRQTNQDKFNLFFASLYSTSDTGPVAAGTTANARRGGISYNRDLDTRWFFFAQSNFEADQFQSLDFRFNPALGFGYHLMKNPRGYLDVLAGVSYDRDYYSNNTIRSAVEIVAGDEFSYKIIGTTTIFEKLQFFPDMTHLGDYRIAFDSNIATTIHKALGFQLGISDRYLSSPPLDLTVIPPVFRKKNDLIFSMGIRYTFASKNQLH
jgi:putative salt-induced outer membrane protein YdiY